MALCGGAGSSRKMLAAIVVGLGPLAGYAVGAVPILEYTFNGSGTTAVSTGSDTSTLGMYTKVNNVSTATSLYSAGGLGVSGAPGDKALDNTMATGQGIGNTGGWTRTASTPSSLVGLQSFTITGWIKPDTNETLSGNAERLIEFYDNATVASGNAGGFRLIGGSGPAQLLLYVNGLTAAPSGTVYGSTDWTFFAVSYDSIAKTVSYYAGSKAASVTLSVTRALDAGAVKSTTSQFYVEGNYNDTNIRPYDGYMDDIRVYGSGTNSSGALSISELEAIRLGDITPVPEPAGLACLGIGTLGAAGLLWRRR